jgi:transposase
MSKPQPRKFSKQDKLCILQAADACSSPAEVAVLLRKEAIYSSYLTTWWKTQGQETSIRGEH